MWVVTGIGPRLRELRLQRNLSPQQLAERSGVSAAAIHRIEGRGMVPTIATLLRLADVLEQPVPAGPIARATADDRSTDMSRRHIEARIVSGARARVLLEKAAVACQSAAGAGGGGAHLGRQSEQLVCVLKGSLQFELDGGEYRLKAGDALHLSGDAPTSTNAAHTPAGAIWVVRRTG